MIQKSQLETLLKQFETAVKNLLDKPSLITALNANIGSIKVLYEEEFSDNGTISLENANFYNILISLCLRKFHEIIPGLNRQARDVDLYREQMAGRMVLVNNFIQRKYPERNDR